MRDDENKGLSYPIALFEDGVVVLLKSCLPGLLSINNPGAARLFLVAFWQMERSICLWPHISW